MKYFSRALFGCMLMIAVPLLGLLFAGAFLAFYGWIPVETPLPEVQTVEVISVVTATPVAPSQSVNLFPPSQVVTDTPAAPPQSYPAPYPGPSLPYVAKDQAYPVPFGWLTNTPAPQFNSELATAYPVFILTATPAPTAQGYYVKEPHDIPTIRRHAGVVCVGNT